MVNKIPNGTPVEPVPFDIKRHYPSMECLIATQKKTLEKRVTDLIEFESNARTSYQVVDFVSKWIESNSFSEQSVLSNDFDFDKKKIYFKDLWGDDSIIAVKEGQRPIDEGFHLILAHGDSPCLKVKPRPLVLEWDYDSIHNFLGIRLSAIAYGGISLHHWAGQQVDVTGYVLEKDGSKRQITFPGVVGDYSSHVDGRTDETVGEAFPHLESLEIITGQTDSRDLLRKLGFSSVDDFSKAKLLAVPNNSPLPLDEYTWNLLVAYGHDDRSCIFSAVDALVKSRNPEYTSIVWVTNGEEVFDPSPSGSKGPLINLVLDYLVEKEEKKSGRKISEREKNLMYVKSSMIIGDVSVAPYGHDASNMDFKSASKLGFGVFIENTDGQGDSPNLSLLNKITNLATGGKSKRNNVCHQMIGNFYKQENAFLREGGVSNSLLSKGVPWAWAGIPCACAHSHNEIICPADEYWTQRLYQKFFESDITI